VRHPQLKARQDGHDVANQRSAAATTASSAARRPPQPTPGGRPAWAPSVASMLSTLHRQPSPVTARNRTFSAVTLAPAHRSTRDHHPTAIAQRGTATRAGRHGRAQCGPCPQDCGGDDHGHEPRGPRATTGAAASIDGHWVGDAALWRPSNNMGADRRGRVTKRGCERTVQRPWRATCWPERSPKL
jgi:hypothetical protein